MAKFLKDKLREPIRSHAAYVPFQSFNMHPSELHDQSSIDGESVGMVAEDKWLGETVAVKSMRTPGEIRQKFGNGAAKLATVQHPNVFRLLGVAFQEDEGTEVLVMELPHRPTHPTSRATFSPDCGHRNYDTDCDGQALPLRASNFATGFESQEYSGQ